MRQLRRYSLLESTLNTVTGFLLAFAAGFVIYPWITGHPVSPLDNLKITGPYTVISVVRGYIWRRAFNWWQHRSF